MGVPQPTRPTAADVAEVVRRAAGDLYRAEVRRQSIGWDDHCTELLVRSQHALAALNLRRGCVIVHPDDHPTDRGALAVQHPGEYRDREQWEDGYRDAITDVFGAGS